MERNRQRNCLVNMLALLVAGLVIFVICRQSNCLSGQLVSYFLGLGVLVCAVSWFQMRLEEQERLERLEIDELTRGTGDTALFEKRESEMFPARHAREQFERFFVPAFTIVLLAAEAVGAWLWWRWLSKPQTALITDPMVALSFLGLFALILFLLGKYTAGLAQLENQRLLQPGAGFLLLGAYLCALGVVGIVMVQAGFQRTDFYLAHALCAMLGLLAAENVVALLLEIYRPRTKGKVGPPLYDSRLIGLLSRPEGILTTAAHALDYQFGFKVSETWFYRFMERAIAWLVLAQLGILFLSTSFVFIEVGEQALLERFGRPVGDGVIGPGFHLKWPWPIDKVHRFRTHEVHQFTIGHSEEQGEEGEHHEEPKLTLWTVSHTRNPLLLLVASREPAAETGPEAEKKTPPVSLVASSVPVQYQISDLKAWAYNHENAEVLLADLATRELARYLVSADLQELMSRSRFEAAQELKRRIQQRADEHKLGVRILFVGLQDVHPPVDVGRAYEAVISAGQKRIADVLDAQAYGVRTNALAKAAALQIKRRAEAERHRATVSARARIALFTNQVAAFQAAPSVYALSAYLRTLTREAAGARKYVLASSNSQDVIQFNLEEKLRPDLLELPLPQPQSQQQK